MRQARLRTGGTVLVATLLLGYAAFAWREVETRALGAAEAEARAVAGAVAAGVDGSLAAGRALEDALAERLIDLASDLTGRLAERPGAARRTMEAFCRTHRLRGAILLGPDLSVLDVASGRPPMPGTGAHGPFDADRVARLEAGRMVALARESGLGARDRVIHGFGDSPFGGRTEFLVGVRAQAAGGHLLLRLDASELDRFRAEAGVERVLATAATAPGIAYLEVVDADGAALVSSRGPVDAVEGTRRAEGAGWVTTGGHGRVLDVVVPATWESAGDDRIRVGFDAAPLESVIAEGRRSVVVSTGLTALLSLLGLTVLARQERRMRAGEERLRHELETRERFAALGRLAGGVAHEIRSPLNALSMAAQRLPRESAPTDPSRRERFDSLVRSLRGSIARVDAVVEDFLAMGREPPPPTLQDVVVGDVVRTAVAVECPEATFKGPAELRVRTDPALLLRALANLLRNAREAAPAGTVQVGWWRERGDVWVVVDDGGPGVADGDAARVFEPFHTRRRGGTGLGLHLARDGIRRVGGDVTLGRAASGGARFAIRLPCVDRPGFDGSGGAT